MSEAMTTHELARTDTILGELRYALGSVGPAEMKAWAADAAQVTGRAGVRRVQTVSSTVGNLARNGKDEFLDAVAAARHGSLLVHGQQRGTALIGVFRRASATAMDRATQLQALARDPGRLPEAVVLVVSALVSAGGIDGDGGLADLDLVLGIGAHRSVLTHSIVAGTVVEGSLYAMATLVGLIYGRLPRQHAPFWDVIEANRTKYLSAVSTGVSAGLAYHLLLDATAQPGAYHGLPVSLPMWGHQTLLGANAVAEGMDVNRKPSTFGHAVGANQQPLQVNAPSRDNGQYWPKEDPGLALLVVHMKWARPGDSMSDAVRRLQATARDGDAEAQYRLAEAYAGGGIGDQQDCRRAAEWYLQAAKQGHSLAQTELGRYLLLGIGIAVDEAASVRWIRAAAEQGEARAQYFFGLMYLDGTGVVADPLVASQWFKKAADQGEPDAADRYGRMLLFGELGRANALAAVPYLKLAASEGCAVAQYHLGLCFLNGLGTARDLSAGADLIEEAANADLATAQYTLGRLFLGGNGRPKNSDAAFGWFRRAAELGEADAQSILGMAHLDGRYVEEDISQAVYWIRRSAEGGSLQSRYRLAMFRMLGYGMPKDMPGAFAEFKALAKAGSIQGMFMLADVCATDRFGWKDETAALYWYTQAAKAGHAEAAFALGSVYGGGQLGVESDLALAVRWINQAAESGSKSALNHLANAYRYGRMGLRVDIRRAAELEERARQARESSMFD